MVNLMSRPSSSRNYDKPVEKGFPIAVPREIVIGHKKALDVLRIVLADDTFQIVRGAVAAPLGVCEAQEAIIRQEHGVPAKGLCAERQ